MGILDVGCYVFTTFLYALILVLERFRHLLVSQASLPDTIYWTLGQKRGMVV